MNWTIVHCREVEAPHHVVLRPLEHHTTCAVLNHSLPVTVTVFLRNRRPTLQPVGTVTTQSVKHYGSGIIPYPGTEPQEMWGADASTQKNLTNTISAAIV